MKIKLLFIIICVVGTGCMSIKKTQENLSKNDQGDMRNAPQFGYTPIDPIPVQIDTSSLKKNTDPLISIFTDETMRLAIGNVNSLANISYGKQFVGFKGQRYIVVLDYIKYITIPFPVDVWVDSTKVHIKALSTFDLNDKAINIPVEDPNIKFGQKSVVPLYIGVGLRITADVVINADSLNLDLFGLGAAASLHKVSGTLVVQTLGISGENITALLPLPSELNQTTIENAIVALGSIKSQIYGPKTLLAPKVLGFYNNIGGIGSEASSYLVSSVLIAPPKIKKLSLN